MPLCCRAVGGSVLLIDEALRLRDRLTSAGDLQAVIREVQAKR